LSYQSIIAQWLAEGKQVGFVKKMQAAPVTVSADSDRSIYKDAGEIIALPCSFLFDSEKMGVELIIDGVDTEKFYTAERLYSLGLIEYNGFIWCSRYEPASNRYAISIATTPKSVELFELKVINTDTTSSHTIINYIANFGKVVATPAMTTYELLKGLYEKLPIVVPPPKVEVEVPPPEVEVRVPPAPPPTPPPTLPAIKLKPEKYVRTRKRGVVEG